MREERANMKGFFTAAFLAAGAWAVIVLGFVLTYNGNGVARWLIGGGVAALPLVILGIVYGANDYETLAADAKQGVNLKREVDRLTIESQGWQAIALASPDKQQKLLAAKAESTRQEVARNNARLGQLSYGYPVGKY
jgi:hypothetical protein